MSRTLLILVVFFQAIQLFSSDNEFYIKPPSPWIEKVRYNAGYQIHPDISDNGGTYLLLDFQENAQLQESYRHIVYVIDEENGIQNYSDIWVDYDPSYQQLIFHELTIHRQKRELNRLKEKDFRIVQNETELERQIYSGNYSAGMYIEDVQVGDIIEYSYTIKGENPIFDGKYFSSFSLNFSVPVNKFVLRFLYPKDRSINYQLIKTDLMPKKSILDNQICLTWEQENIPEVVLNSNLPSWYNAYCQVQLSEFSQWSDVIEWSVPLYPPIDIENTALELKFNEITKGKQDENEKINAIIQFVQDEIRYVGIEVNEYSHRPHSPIEVYSKRFGDCKDKAYLLVTLLRHMGVEAWPAYVNTELKQEVSTFLPAPTIFNHVIVAISQKEKLHFVDATTTNQRGDFKNAYVGNYVSALVLDQSYNGLTNIPLSSNEKIIIRERLEVSDSLQPTKFSVISTYFGSEADNMRLSFKNQTAKEQEVSYLNFYDYLYPNMKMTDPIKITDDHEDNVFMVEENYKIENFWTYNYEESIDDYESVLNATNLKYFIPTPSQKNRSMPFALYYPIEIENTIEYVSKKDVSIEETQGEISNPCFRFTYDVKKIGKTIVFTYYYKSLKDCVLVDELPQYYRDVDNITDQVYYEFTYGKNDNETEGTTNWLIVILVSLYTIILIYFATILYQKDVETLSLTIKPMPLGGWLILPVIGVFTTPMIVLYTIFSSGFFDQESWVFISSRDSVGYDIFWTIGFLFELLMNCLVVVYSVFLIILLVKKRTIFPLHYVTLRVVVLVFVTVDAYLLSLIESEYFVSEPANIREIVTSIIGAAIWIPYMMKSQRVKDTFINVHLKNKPFLAEEKSLSHPSSNVVTPNT